MKSSIEGAIKPLFQKLREEGPLVHHITNPVTMNDCANCTLAIGGSPIMAMSIEEVAEIVQKAQALVVNMGVLQETSYKAMVAAGKAANRQGIPVILDPVGIGASSYRYQRIHQYLTAVDVSIIRGNAAEIQSLLGKNAETHGVDAGRIENISLPTLAIEAANQFQAIIVLSGQEDVVTDGEDYILVQNGEEWLTKVTGTGCMTTSLIASFASMTKDYFHAAIAGISTMAIAGELARESLSAQEGIGTFRMRLFDAISQMNGELWGKQVRVRCK